MDEIETAANLDTAAAESTTQTVESTEKVEEAVNATTTETAIDNETESKEVHKTESEVPESYKEFTLPEGMEYDVEVADSFKAVAKELGLSQEAAQKLVDYQTNIAKVQQDAHVKQMESWRQESEKSIGKDGIEEANRALNQFASPEFVQYLNESGLGNHPAMIAAFKNVYEKIGESSFVDNNTSGQVSLRNDYSKLYPSMKDFYK